MKDAMNRKVLTVPEAGAQLGLGRNASYAAAKSGAIPTIKLGKLLRVPIRALEQMLDSTANTGAKGTGRATQTD
jgi:excisionase family DNA binding protein